MLLINRAIVAFIFALALNGCAKLEASEELKPRSFSQAKTLASAIYEQHPYSFYCRCKLYWSEKKILPDLSSCGYKVRKQPFRANRIEWEHLVPAWQFGHQLKCWQDGGRKNCRKDSIFNEMESDLHNLVPSVGEINGDRSNYNFSSWGEAPSQYGSCPVVVDFKARKVQPPDYTRGMIARAYLYMGDAYGFKLSKQQLRLMEAWNNIYPPSEWECSRNTLIMKQAGTFNRFTSQACQALGDLDN